MSFVGELKRRNVFRVGAAYAVAAWLLMQVVDVVIPVIEAPGWVAKSLLLLLAIGFPVALIFAWAFELTPEGLKFERDVDRSASITPSTGRTTRYSRSSRISRISLPARYRPRWVSTCPRTSRREN